MDWRLVVLTFLHVGGGAVWLGASAIANVAIVPFLRRAEPSQRPELVERLVLAPERLVIGSALTAGVTGLILGLAFRGLGDSVSFNDPPGLVWLAAIALALGVFAVGGRITSPAARTLRSPDASDQALARLALGFRFEFLGIAAILALMVVLPRV